MRLFSNKARPVHLSSYPVERLKRAPVSDDLLKSLQARSASAHRNGAPDPANTLAKICRDYGAIYDEFRNGDVAPEPAPFSTDLQARADELKSLTLFFDATLAGVCRLVPIAWAG